VRSAAEKNPLGLLTREMFNPQMGTGKDLTVEGDLTELKDAVTNTTRSLWLLQRVGVQFSGEEYGCVKREANHETSLGPNRHFNLRCEGFWALSYAPQNGVKRDRVGLWTGLCPSTEG